MSLVGVSVAHGGGLANARPERLAVPAWLFLLTGGTVIGASFLLASFLTDRAVISSVTSRRVSVLAADSIPVSHLLWGARFVGLGGLFVVLWSGLFGPRRAIQNAAVLLVWAGWWAGYPTTVYLGGNSWPAIDPFRTLARPLGDGLVEYPRWVGGWPSVVGLLALISLEVASPVADDPRVLAVTVSCYLAVTLAGAFLVGQDAWFANVDPVSGVFRLYGNVGPVQWRRSSLWITLPGSALVEAAAIDRADGGAAIDRADGGAAFDRADVGLVVALVWGTTYDGLVGTPLWADGAVSVVEAGIPATLLYPAVLLVGYVGFIGVYWLACRYVRQVAPTYLDATTIARLFAPSLLPIAAGYHLAHNLGYVLTLSPALLTAIPTPLQTPPGRTLVLPDWFGGVSIAAVLLGHILAVWVAHSVAFGQFPDKVQAIRSQYPITLVLIAYTMLSLWIVTRPFVAPPYL